MPDDIAISVNSVSKNFKLPHEKTSSIKALFTGLAKSKNRGVETQHALRDMSFEVKKGEFFGIVGRNGSGKSTMLKILARIYQPTSGNVRIAGKLVPFIELGVGFNPELTGRENVYLNGAMLGFSKKEIDAMYNDIVAFAELERFMDQKLKNYSSGMQVRLAFSMATRAEADILLVDEILAVGDAAFQRKCYDYFRTIKRAETTVIFVTHDMNAVREYCDRAILIEDSRLVKEGNPDEIANAYTKMFIDEGEDSGEAQQKRWGNEAVTYTKASISARKLTADEKELTLTLEARANRDVADPIFGFLIKTSAHAAVLGTNTLIAGHKPQPLKKDQGITLSWIIPNVFNDGLHYIDPAITYGGGSEVADWWEEALSFRAFTEHHTPYIVNPPINLSIEQKT